MIRREDVRVGERYRGRFYATGRVSVREIVAIRPLGGVKYRDTDTGRSGWIQWSTFEGWAKERVRAPSPDSPAPLTGIADILFGEAP